MSVPAGRSGSGPGEDSAEHALDGERPEEGDQE